MSTNKLFYKALIMANDNGKSFLNSWLSSSSILKIIPTRENWFYVIYKHKNSNPHVASISQKNDCHSAFFGSIKHLNKTNNLNLKY